MYIDQHTLLCEILYTTQVLAEATLQLLPGLHPLVCSLEIRLCMVMIQGKPVVITISLLFI